MAETYDPQGLPVAVISTLNNICGLLPDGMFNVMAMWLELKAEKIDDDSALNGNTGRCSPESPQPMTLSR